MVKILFSPISIFFQSKELRSKMEERERVRERKIASEGESGGGEGSTEITEDARQSRHGKLALKN